MSYEPDIFEVALKGHPEFNPDQARDEHGRWTGGGGVGDRREAQLLRRRALAQRRRVAAQMEDVRQAIKDKNAEDFKRAAKRLKRAAEAVRRTAERARDRLGSVKELKVLSDVLGLARLAMEAVVLVSAASLVGKINAEAAGLLLVAGTVYILYDGFRMLRRWKVF